MALIGTCVPLCFPSASAKKTDRNKKSKYLITLNLIPVFPKELLAVFKCCFKLFPGVGI